MPEIQKQNIYVGQPDMTVAPACPGGQLYTVKSGDTMFFIARGFNITLQSLINANPQISDPNTIYPGQVICIPVTVPSPGPGVSCPGGQIYTVVSGDTMFDIARRFGVTLDALISANPQITNPDLIYPGQDICVPAAAVIGPVPMPVPCPVPGPVSVPCPGMVPGPVPIPVPTPVPSPVSVPCPGMVPGPVPPVSIPSPAPVPVPCPGGVLYVVKSGDTMFDIAKMNGISLATLIMANPQIPDPNMIFPGQVICVPQPVMEQPAMPLPEIPAPMPTPMPMPAPPPSVVSPIFTMPTQPAMPPMQPAMPCPPAGTMVQPMPVYIVIPWEECPYRNRRKKKGHHHKGCCK